MLRICLQRFVQDCVTHALHLIWQSFSKQVFFKAPIGDCLYYRGTLETQASIYGGAFVMEFLEFFCFHP